MQLWNDYEGKTIAEAYPLEKLISPEGRSAFFSTHNGTGTPAVIRLIEPHYDNDEILERWRQVTALQDPNLISIRKYGQTELDGASVLYAVMEPSDDNLAEVLKHRALNPQETRDIAVSLVAALQALHANRLIHEHIEPANVLATGDLIKLRSDCVREIPDNPEAPEEAIALRARDVHDLSVTLLQALTLRHTLSGTPLATPFDAIIRNGISGAWGLPEIAAALTPPSAAKPLAAPAPAAPVQTSAPKPQPSSIDAKFLASQAVQTPQTPKFAPRVSDRLIRPVDDIPSRPRGLWIGGGVAALALLLFVWHHFSSTSVAAPAAPAPVQQASRNSAPATAATPPTATPHPTKPAAGRSSTTLAAATRTPATAAKPTATTAAPNTTGHTQWRVVAFTYNHEDQAQHKAESLSARYASLHPGVFSPTGQAPYLVTLGGPMDRDQAIALRDQSRSSGLPPDTYIQNYSH